MFSLAQPPLLPFAPFLQKMCHLFYVIDLDLQESPPCPAVLFCGQSLGRVMGGQHGGEGKRQRGSLRAVFEGLLLLSSYHVSHEDVCVYGREKEKERTGELNISTQPSQQRHFHSRWSGSAAIWRPRWPDNLRYLQTPNFV